MANCRIEDASKLFKSLSDPTRIRILNLLWQEALCVCEIIEIIKLAPSTVSKHLSLMSSALVLDSKKEGKWVYYKINKTRSIQYSTVKLIMEALKKDKQLELDLQKLKKIKKGAICKTK